MEGFTHLVDVYGYWVLIPLSFIEGPIVAFFAGTLASLGYFNFWVLAVLFLVRDVLVDLGCYYIGFFGSRASWFMKLLKRFGVSDNHLNDVRALWHNHPGKTMFLSKLSYGVAAGFIMVAGLVRMSVPKFLGYGVLIALCHYGTLLVIGYFFGTTFGGSISSILENIPYVIGGLSVLLVAYIIFKRYMTSTLKKAEESEKTHND